MFGSNIATKNVELICFEVFWVAILLPKRFNSFALKYLVSHSNALNLQTLRVASQR